MTKNRRIEQVHIGYRFVTTLAERRITPESDPASYRLNAAAASLARSDRSLHPVDALNVIEAHDPALAAAAWAEHVRWIESAEFKAQASILDRFTYLERGEMQGPREVTRTIRDIPRILGVRPFTIPEGSWGCRPHPYFHRTETVVTKEHIELAVMAVLDQPAWEKLTPKEVAPYMFRAIKRQAERIATHEKERGGIRDGFQGVRLDAGEGGEAADGDVDPGYSGPCSRANEGQARVAVEALLRGAILRNRSKREVAVLSEALLQIEKGEPLDLDDVIADLFRPPGHDRGTGKIVLTPNERDVKRRVLSRLRLVAGGSRRK